jgi:hypothetical protein
MAAGEAERLRHRGLELRGIRIAEGSDHAAPERGEMAAYTPSACTEIARDRPDVGAGAAAHLLVGDCRSPLPLRESSTSRADTVTSGPRKLHRLTLAHERYARLPSTRMALTLLGTWLIYTGEAEGGRTEAP